MLAFGLWIYSSRLQAVRALWFRATSRLESRAVGLQDFKSLLAIGRNDNDKWRVNVGS